MLKKTQRLTKAEFDRYFKIGKRYHSEHLQLIHQPNINFRAAVVVGKKVFKSAVKRNQLRRRLYGVIYRQHQNRSLQGMFIMIAKASAKTATKKALLHEAHTLVRKIG